MSNFDEIRKLREEIVRKQSLLQSLEEQSFDVYGVWKVSTEGDCEGRSVQQLGTYSGNVFDIVKQLCGQSYYQLRVERVGHYRPNQEAEKKQREVHFNIIDRAVKLHDKADQLNKLREHVPEGHTISDSNYYGAVKLVWVE